jgi:hypothetical protein
MNALLVALDAVVEHINAHAELPPETVAAEKVLRTELDKLTKKELIERLVRQQIRKNVKVVQGDLLASIFCDPRCVILTYEEIRDQILDNLETDQKFSVSNLSWYRSHLRNVKGLPVLNPMTAKERAAYDHKVMKEIALTNK